MTGTILMPARPKISTESNKFFIELVCFPGQVLKQCKTLGQSLDHDALVAINKKLEKEPQTTKTLIFRRCRICFIEKRKNKKETIENEKIEII